MSGTLTVIWWRDIPAQVVARSGRRATKVVLHPRFQTAIDRAAMRAGKRAASDYIGEWRKTQRPCGDDLDAEVEAEVARLEALYSREVLQRLVASGGLEPSLPRQAGYPPTELDQTPPTSTVGEEGP
jgi:hypothetical protein